MCLVNIAFQIVPGVPLVLAANRDEFYNRPTAPSHWWEDAPHILAGRDLSKGGTWLGVSKSGRICALTNYRDPSEFSVEKESRGHIVRSFLEGEMHARTFLEELDREKERYPGFNVIAGTKEAMYSFSSKSDKPPYELPPGIHSVSNAFMNTPWPKTIKAKKKLAEWADNYEQADYSGLFALLADETRALDEQLPQTGVSLEWERMLSPAFIKSENNDYGTRSSTVVLIKQDNSIDWVERTFEAGVFEQEQCISFTKN
ncbi:NRDE family protein [Domibacillus aminovorans]|uniref:NRDE family protein n=1 Tax=Domibacillus aminovorans TaxID=29332 RepID=A0A177L5W3_9BACI|nr:NRDE family protein [Domibacillus aminovorans]OAH60814.1 hypothetical protein AWH49_15300 [Domibacillus aminovorans]